MTRTNVVTYARSRWRTISMWSALGCAVLLAACAKKPDEKALLDTINSMQAAVSSREAGAFMAHLGSSFRAESADTGPLDREGARRTLAGLMLMYPNITVASTTRELSIVGTQAKTTVEVIAGAGANALPDAVRHFTFHLEWSHDGKGWKLMRAQWDR